MKWCVAVDPGIDATGVACFTLNGWTPAETWEQVLGRLAQYYVLRTPAARAIPDRICDLHRGLRELVQEFPGDVPVLIERPAIAGAYAERQGRQRTRRPINAGAMEKLLLAIGALLAAGGYGGGAPELVPAPRIPKRDRQRLVLATLQRQGHPLAARARPSPDLLDAIWLGATWLTAPARRVRVA